MRLPSSFACSISPRSSNASRFEARDILRNSTMKLRELAERLACRLEGDGEIEIVRVAGIQDAGPGDLTFVANPKYLSALATTRASAVLLRDDAPGAPEATGRAVLRTPD